MHDYRLHLLPDGSIAPRRFSLEEALILGNDLQARREPILSSLPETLKAFGAQLLDRIQASTQTIEGLRKQLQAPAPAPDPGQIPEALRLLGSVEQLLSLRFVNNLEDVEVGTLEGFLALKKRGTGAAAEAAGRLHQSWFSDGRTFLKAASRDQWLAVHERVQRPTAAQLEDLDTLQLQEELARLQAVNTWHGALLGIHQADAPTRPPASPEAQLADALDAFQQHMLQALALAQLAWPEDAAGRALLVGRFMDIMRLRAGRS